MALALLDFEGFEGRGLRFGIDTGTNRYYQLKFGREVRRDDDVDAVDELYLTTPLAVSPTGGGLLNSKTTAVVPRADIHSGPAYAQLVTFKSPDGRSPAYSRVVTVSSIGGGARLSPAGRYLELTMSPVGTATRAAPVAFRPARTVPCRTPEQQYARATSLADILGQLAQIAGPIVTDLLRGTGHNAPAAATPPAAGSTTTGTPPAGPPATAPADLIAGLLRMVLGAAAGGDAARGLSLSTSTAGRAGSTRSRRPGNRFTGTPGGLSRPMIFGIDDALIASLVGPVLQVLPQLMNAANQHRAQLRASNNKLVTDLLAEVDRRRLLEQLLQVRQAAPATGGSAEDLLRLEEMLRQAAPDSSTSAASSPAAAAPAAPTAATQSLQPGAVVTAVASRAALSFVTSDPVTVGGASRVLYARDRAIQLRVRLDVGESGPRTPLPRALLALVVKDPRDEAVLLEKSVRQQGLQPGLPIPVELTVAEVALLPTGRPLTVLAQLRWRTTAGTTYQATGTTDVTLVDPYFLSGRGAKVSHEVELTDMVQFRPFWNKVWEAPVLQGPAADGSAKQYHWSLDATMRYSVVLSPDHDENGLMESRVLQVPQEPDALTDRTEGRLKAGIELSIGELNKLLALWPQEQPLDPDRLAPLRTEGFARGNASELMHPLRLRGRAGQRGLVWVVPVFALHAVTLGRVRNTDDAGQVVGVDEEQVRFPLPTAVRVLGLTGTE